MKKYKAYIVSTLFILVPVLTSSCTDYLDKSPDSDISETDAYKDFTNFQGFVEEIYACIPDFAKGYWTNSWNWGEDEILNVGIDYHMCYKVDQGDFWGWQTEYDGWQSGWMDRDSFDPSGDRFSMSLWRGAWYAIRKCNMGLENLDLMTDCTEEEHDLIEGQLYFFRGFFHFELIQFFGGLPYIETVLSSSDDLDFARPSYHECAEKAAADLEKAAELLPIDWDDTTVGRSTLGKNQLRITKIAALGYLGKDLLWAGSPLMNEESTGSATYNSDYCQRAAEAFGELIELVEDGDTQFGLIDWDDSSQNWFTINQNNKMPGQSTDETVVEAIMRGPSSGYGGARWGLALEFGGFHLTGTGVFNLPTANYVNYYGMANGLPLDDEESGFDEEYPWKDRDPRFYRDIIYDGAMTIEKDLEEGDDGYDYKYASLYTDGSMRDESTESRTGYFMYKFINVSCNQFDDGYDWSSQIHIHIPWMRLADVYLMYAEAAAQAGGTSAAKYGCSLTAAEAVNKVRARSNVPDIDSKYTGTLDNFMSELRRERAVELAFEGHRFNDLRRWKLLDVYPYNIKTSQEFIRATTYDFDSEDYDPTQNRVSGWSEEQILKRDFSEKHYWLPLKKSDVDLYEDFEQNPGW